VPEDVRDAVRFCPVSSADEVLRVALLRDNGSVRDDMVPTPAVDR
jgi:hypothetical protein